MKYFILVLALCFSLGASYDDFAYAVRLGFPVTMSTAWDALHCNPRLDNEQRVGVPSAWAAGFNDIHQWIQVSSETPKTWAGVITQGRFDFDDQWVTSFIVLWSNDGVNWTAVDEAKEFKGNSDRNTKVTNYFDTPVLARTIRIRPTTWNKHISMRFDAIFYTNQES